MRAVPKTVTRWAYKILTSSVYINILLLDLLLKYWLKTQQNRGITRVLGARGLKQQSAPPLPNLLVLGKGAKVKCYSMNNVGPLSNLTTEIKFVAIDNFWLIQRNLSRNSNNDSDRNSYNAPTRPTGIPRAHRRTIVSLLYWLLCWLVIKIGEAVLRPSPAAPWGTCPVCPPPCHCKKGRWGASLGLYTPLRGRTPYVICRPAMVTILDKDGRLSPLPPPPNY